MEKYLVERYLPEYREVYLRSTRNNTKPLQLA